MGKRARSDWDKTRPLTGAEIRRTVGVTAADIAVARAALSGTFRSLPANIRKRYKKLAARRAHQYQEG